MHIVEKVVVVVQSDDTSAVEEFFKATPTTRMDIRKCLDAGVGGKLEQHLLGFKQVGLKQAVSDALENMSEIGIAS